MLARVKQPSIAGVEPQSDPALNRLVRERLLRTDVSKGVLLDGYPATKGHADYLAELLKEMELPSPVVIQLDVPDDEVRKRLKKRGLPEDTPENIEQLLKDYHREMDLIRLYFPAADINTVNGKASPKKVSKAIQDILDKRLK